MSPLCLDLVQRVKRWRVFGREIASKLGKQRKQERIIKGRPIAFVTQTTFGGVGFKNIESHMADHCHILGTIADTDRAMILMEGNSTQR